MEVLKEKLDLLQDLVTGLTRPRAAPAEPTPEPSVVADGSGDDKALEDAEINRHIAKLADSDPGDRYSAVIALGHYSGSRVVKALEGMLSPEPDPEDVMAAEALTQYDRARALRRQGSYDVAILSYTDAIGNEHPSVPKLFPASITGLIPRAFGCLQGPGEVSERARDVPRPAVAAQ